MRFAFGVLYSVLLFVCDGHMGGLYEMLICLWSGASGASGVYL